MLNKKIMSKISVAMSLMITITALSPINSYALNENNSQGLIQEYTSAKNLEDDYKSLYPEINFKVLVDNKSIRKVETSDDNAKYIVTYNKNKRTMDVVIHKLKNKGTKIESTQKYYLNLDNVNESYMISEDGKVEAVFDEKETRASIKQNTWSNYEYTKTLGTTNKWELRRPDPKNPVFKRIYFTTKETNSNKTYLNSFMDYVEKINTQESTILWSISSSVFTDILLYLSGIGNVFTGGTLTSTMVAAAAASVGAKGVVVNQFVTLGSYWRYAYNYYYSVYNRRA